MTGNGSTAAAPRPDSLAQYLVEIGRHPLLTPTEEVRLAKRIERGVPERVSEAALRASSQVAAGCGPHATYACIDTWLTDCRGDLPKIDIPVLAIHGTADRVLPFEVTTARLRDEQLIADLTVVAIADGPHNVGWTHPDEVNSALLSFLHSDAGDRPGAMAAAGQM